jgi:hypothetical protein
MTNLVNKTQLLAALNHLVSAIELMRPMNRVVDQVCKNTRLADVEDGALRILDTIGNGLQEGDFDASLEDVLDEAGIEVYVEEDLDTEDMDDLAPEEESVATGIIMLPPCPSPEERAELVRWYNSKGWGIVEL